MKITSLISTSFILVTCYTIPITNADPGDVIDRHLDRRGDRIDECLDRKGDRIEDRWDR